MTQREFRDFLQDIIYSISQIEEITQEITFAGFSTRTETFFFVVKLIEIIGEAVISVISYQLSVTTA